MSEHSRRCKVLLPLQASEDFCYFIFTGETLRKVKQLGLKALGESNQLMRIVLSSSSGALRIFFPEINQ